MNHLYNNIQLPEHWPPYQKEETLDRPLHVPYLDAKPEYIDISVGRQLFVDDFLISSTNLSRQYESPTIPDEPVFYPETELELNNGYCTCACPFNGGVFFDQKDRTYKMWYHAGWFDGTAYAESYDGIHWKRLTQIDSSRESDRVLERIPGYLRDGDAVWIDEETTDPKERYKMLVFYRCFEEDFRYYHLKPKHAHDDPNSVPPTEITVLYRSADGISWEKMGEMGHAGDNTTFFYNPFRKKWVFSLRTFSELDSRVRTRGYYEVSDFFDGCKIDMQNVSFWSRTDIFDKPDPELGYYTQLYNLDAVAYESVMLGVYSVFMGPPNFVCEKTGRPKINDLKLGFSRDGFHFSRLGYQDFISSSRKEGRWDYGYLHPANGICVVQEDELFFYYSAFSGASPEFTQHKYSGGAVGVAKLRRDGFAYMTDNGNGGTLTTELVKYTGKYFYINADCQEGSLAVELLDGNGQVLSGYSKEECVLFKGNSTKHRICWSEHSELENVCDKIRIRFVLSNAKLYSFWITDDKDGKSHGYLAAGSPTADTLPKDE